MTLEHELEMGDGNTSNLVLNLIFLLVASMKIVKARRGKNRTVC